MDSLMQPNVLFSALIVIGAAIFIYFYHVRIRQFDSSDREQVRNWRFYGIIDVWLKVSTLGITLLALNVHARWLLPYHDNLILRTIGFLIAAGAWGLFLWAIGTLADQYTPAHIARAPKRLVTEGPYRFIRHPIYAANLWLLLGMLLLSGSLWLLVNLAILLSHYIPTVVMEERAIAERLPGYREYARRTGRIFPKVGRPRNSDSR